MNRLDVIYDGTWCWAFRRSPFGWCAYVGPLTVFWWAKRKRGGA